jgi:hypothetical protein
MNGLLLHCGSQAATLERIDTVPTPEPTATHFPIPHGLLVKHVRSQLLGAGVEIREEAYGLSTDGMRLFGILALHAERLPTINGSGLVLGLRNSHDQTFSAGLSLGNRVIVCDNLSFYGTRTLARKHTRYCERDLPGLIARILGQLGDWANRQAERFAAYQEAELTEVQAHDFMIRAVRGRVIAPSRIPHVIQAWDKHEGNGESWSLWALFNAFTDALKGTMELSELARRTEKLHGLADLQVERLHHPGDNGHSNGTGHSSGNDGGAPLALSAPKLKPPMQPTLS